MTKGVLAWLGLTMMAVAAAAQTTVTTSGGTTNTVPVFTGTSTVGNSPITVSGSNVGIGTTAPTGLLQIQANQHAITRVIVGNTDMTTGDYGTQAGYWVYGTASNDSIGALKWVPTLLSGTGALYLTTEADYPLAFGINSSPTPSMTIATNGAVGIGTTAPAYNLDVTGQIRATTGYVFPDGSTQTTAFIPANCGADYAESVGVTGDRTSFTPGDLLVIDPSNPGSFLKSNQPYSTLIAGVYSTKPGFVGRLEPASAKTDATEVPMAMVGRVPTKVSAENGPIKVGDLLVSSSTVGYAMKGTDRSLLTGAVIGKALGSLDSGTGTILVLVTLQ